MTTCRCLRYLHNGYQDYSRSGAQTHIISRFLKSLHVWPRQVCTTYYYWGWNLVSHWNPESEQESMQSRHASSSPPSKFKTQPSTGKIMATIFLDSKGVLLIDYLPDKNTMNGLYYANLLLKLRQAIWDKRREMLRHVVWLVHDNSPVHKSTLPSMLYATVASYS